MHFNLKADNYKNYSTFLTVFILVGVFPCRKIQDIYMTYYKKIAYTHELVWSHK